MMLLACQSLPDSYFEPFADRTDNLEMSSSLSHTKDIATGTPIQEVSIACEGTYHCEITQIDNTLLINTETHLPSVEGVEGLKQPDTHQRDNTNNPSATKHTATHGSHYFTNGMALIPLMETNLEGLYNYYALVNSGKHEVHINFYPESNDSYVERFAIIHEFSKPVDYKIRAFRQPLDSRADSLLDTAAPEPLCVYLLEAEQPVRQFCKIDTQAQQNEFVETIVTTKAL